MGGDDRPLAAEGPLLKTDDPAVKTWLEERSQETKDKVEEDKVKEQRRRYMFGACYLLAMGVCGMVLLALGSTISELAANCGTTATSVGSVFITRGCGAIAGAVSSAQLYSTFEGNHVIITTLLTLAGVLIYMPFITEVWELHLSFGLLGICTAITDTGCQIMTRFIHGSDAGPWLGANTVAFGLAAALVPAIGYATSSLYLQYSVLAAIAVSGAVALFFAGTADIEYKTEIIVACMVFWLIGGSDTATAFLESYVDDTYVISSGDADLLIMVLWIAVTVGRVLGVVDQNFINTPVLYHHLTIFLVGGVLAMALILTLSSNAPALWIGVGAYGFFYGPTVGYCYDLVNRLTIPSEQGMAIVMFGLNFGASLVPYATSQVWDSGAGPDTLTVTVFLSMLIPLPLLYFTTMFHNDNSAYEPLPTTDPDTLPDA